MNACFIHSLTETTQAQQVFATAKKLSTILQQNDNMALSPDPATAGVLNTWLETHLPVSYLCSMQTIKLALKRKSFFCAHRVVNGILKHTVHTIQYVIYIHFYPHKF